MSVYVGTSTEAPAFLCSNRGWAEFCAFVHGLPVSGHDELIHLREYGWSQQLERLRRQLTAAMQRERPHRDVLSVGRALFPHLQSEGVLAITDGLGPARPAAKHSELPPIRQEESWSCGAAALRSVLAHYGRDMPEARLREVLGSSPESGTPPAAMLAGARRLGLDAGMKEDMSLPELERYMILGRPVIVCLQAQEGSAGEVQRLEAGHWVVAQRKRDGRYEFMDPALGGTGYLTRQQLLERWRDRDGDGREYRRLGIVVRGKEQSGEP